ncbi:DUF4817 domain-containing protein [Trichonephila clavipes]|uniref:DUF4817 domain-containing protein n=1 Tax=Trichonephila clavipes TaxID=2585209 RepID=A0A8X7BCY5_TRICX|nr:DUF4817 domain-containing protein [Trichonephila clavipes]
MITNFFIPQLNNHDVQELWFQQDGATCHTDRTTIDLLKDTFGDRLISRFGPVNWPPRSCDLTMLDNFLWSYVKSLVYADKPQTLNYLEDNIIRIPDGVTQSLITRPTICETHLGNKKSIRSSLQISFIQGKIHRVKRLRDHEVKCTTSQNKFIIVVNVQHIRFYFKGNATIIQNNSSGEENESAVENQNLAEYLQHDSVRTLPSPIRKHFHRNRQPPKRFE